MFHRSRLGPFARRRRSRLGGLSRRGTATVELAVCLPMLALIVFGGLQACELIYLKHTLTSAAYEGTLELARYNVERRDIIARAKQVLQDHHIQNASVSVHSSKGQLSQLPIGEGVEIVVRAPVKKNLNVAGFFVTPRIVEAHITATR